MTKRKDTRPRWVLSRHLSLAATYAGILARSRQQETIGVTEFIAGCYIADPIRFLYFWDDAFSCIEGLRRDCGLLDPVVLYQATLTEQFRSELETRGSTCYFYSDDMRKKLLETAEKEGSNGATQIDLPRLLLTVRHDPRLFHVFKAGFRSRLAHERARSTQRTPSD